MTGAKGENGATGPAGDKGAQGAPGAKGPKGFKGSVGQPGLPGRKGERGKDVSPYKEIVSQPENILKLLFSYYCYMYINYISKDFNDKNFPKFHQESRFQLTTCILDHTYLVPKIL